MLEFDMVQSGLLILLMLVLGEICSKKMKAVVPAVLIAGLVYVAGVWSGVLPADMVEQSGLTVLSSVGMMLVIVNMGSTTNGKELLANWRVVTLAVISFAFQLAVLFLVIGGIFGINTAVGSLPGGTATVLIIQEKARVLEYDHIIVLSVMILSMRGLAACPLVSMLLKKEVKRIRAEKTAGNKRMLMSEADRETEAAVTEGANPTGNGKRTGLAAFRLKMLSFRKKDESHYWPLFRLYAVAWLASRLTILTGISKYVLCLFLGILFVELGFLEKNELEKTKSQGLIFFMMMAVVMNGFASATPGKLAQVLVPLVCVMACEVGSIFLVCSFLGPWLGFSRPMGIAIGLNVMIGFPLNMMITEDVMSYLVEDPEERREMVSDIGTRMIIGGFTSTTFLATVAAGFLVVLMH